MWVITYITRNIKKLLAKNSRNIRNFIILVLFIIFTLQIANQMSKNNKEKKENEQKEILGNITYNSINEMYSQLDLFIENCKSGNIDYTYNMLSDNCKDNLYNTKELFKSEYLDKYYNGNAKYKTEFIRGYNGFAIYNVSIKNVSIETVETNLYKEVICISDNDKKININGFFEKKDVNKVYNFNNIIISIENYFEYADYRIYNIKINNISEKEIAIESNNINIYDDNSSLCDSNIINNVDFLKIGENNIKLKVEKQIYDKSKISSMILTYIDDVKKEINIELE